MQEDSFLTNLAHQTKKWAHHGVLTVSSGAYGPTFPQGILFVQTYITCLSIMPSRCWKSMCQNDTKLEPGSDCNVVSKVPNKRNPFNLIIQYINNKYLPPVVLYVCTVVSDSSFNITITLAPYFQCCKLEQKLVQLKMPYLARNPRKNYENDQLNLSLP